MLLYQVGVGFRVGKCSKSIFFQWTTIKSNYFSIFRQYFADQRNGEDNEGPIIEGIATMNLFICLVSRYFDQTDLVDCDD